MYWFTFKKKVERNAIESMQTVNPSTITKRGNATHDMHYTSLDWNRVVPDAALRGLARERIRNTLAPTAAIIRCRA